MSGVGALTSIITAYAVRRLTKRLNISINKTEKMLKIGY